MSDLNNANFEISNSDNSVLIEPLHCVNDDSGHDWDKNWIAAKVTVKAAAFKGEFIADFMTTDFELFKREVKKLDRDFNGTAKFEPLEGQLILNIKGDGIGHFEVKCSASDKPGDGGILSFTLSFDQTQLGKLINGLDRITKAFPIKGNMALKNE